MTLRDMHQRLPSMSAHFALCEQPARGDAIPDVGTSTRSRPRSPPHASIALMQ